MSPAEQLVKKIGKSAAPEPLAGRRIGCNLREIRMALGLRQIAASDAMCMPQSMLARFEGGSVPNLETAIKIAAFYGKHVEEIWFIPNGHESSKM